MRIKNLFLIICLLLSISSFGYIFGDNKALDEIEIKTAVDKDQMYICEVLKFTILIIGEFEEIPQIESFQIPQFKILNITRTHNFSISGEDIQAESEIIYFLKPKTSGELTIPSISIKYKSKVYTTKPINIKVLPAKIRPKFTPGESILL